MFFGTRKFGEKQEKFGFALAPNDSPVATGLQKTTYMQKIYENVKSLVNASKQAMRTKNVIDSHRNRATKPEKQVIANTRHDRNTK